MRAEPQVGEQFVHVSVACSGSRLFTHSNNWIALCSRLQADNISYRFIAGRCINNNTGLDPFLDTYAVAVTHPMNL